MAVEVLPLAGELAGLVSAVRPMIQLPSSGDGARIGVPETARAVTIAALIQETGPTLLLSASPSQAQAMFEELQLYVAGLPLFRLPEQERLPYELARTDPAFEIQAAQALRALTSEQPALIVASWVAAAERRAGPGLASAGTFVSTGDTLAPGELASRLEADGYEADHLADRPGTFVRRGGILDIFPANSPSALRVDFFGNEIESLRELNLVTQRSTGRLESVHIPPMPTGARQASQAAKALLELVEDTGEAAEAYIEQLQLVAEGHRSQFDASLEPLLYESCALDFMHPSTLILYDDALEGRIALNKTVEHHERSRSEHETRGLIPRGLPPIMTPEDDLQRLLQAREKRIHIERFGSTELGARRLPLKVTPAFAGKLHTLTQQAGAWRNAGKTVVIASQQALRLSELLDESGVPAALARGLEGPPEPGSVTLLPIRGRRRIHG